MSAVRKLATLKNSYLFLILVTSISGFLLGAAVRPTWQAAVEGAQALSGVVTYPSGNAFYMYHVKLWTIVNQILALMLKLGFSERTLSILTSGVLGALCYAAIGLCGFAVSRSAFWGIAAPFLIDFRLLRRTLEVNYPLELMGTVHTYGVIGLGWLVLTVSLLALGRWRSAGLALGLAPAIHPGLGVWCWMVVVLTLIWNGSDSFDAVRAIWKPTLAGLSVTVASLLIQVAWMRPVLPSIAPEVQERFVAAWVAFFDYHRRPVNLSLTGVQLSIALVVIGLYLILILQQERDAVSLFALKAAVVTAALALGGAAVSLLPPSTVPLSILALMPTRLFLAANLLFVAILIGLAGRYLNLWVSGALFVCFVAATTYYNERSMLYGLIAAGAVFMVWKSVTLRREKLEFLTAPRWMNLVAGVLVFALIGRGVMAHVKWGTTDRRSLDDLPANPVVMAVAAGKGTLLTGQQCCFFTQLLTRRPLLLAADALDQIPYVPESAPAVNEALRTIYGVDLLDPPEFLKGFGLPQGLTPVTRPVWEKRSAEEWIRLGEAFGFTQILTNAEWRLNLPEAARDATEVLYTIPSR